MCKNTSLCQSLDSVAVQLDTVRVLKEVPGNQSVSRSFSTEEIRMAPGSIGDPMRALDLSAEVVSSSDLQAVPTIGGDEADGILTLLDGFPVTYPYRMLGSFSLFNSLTTSEIELLSSGYSVSYGGFAPTAIRVNSEKDYNSHTKLETDLSFFTSSVFAEIPISDSLRWSAKISARSSHIGLAADMLSGPSRERLKSFMPDLKDGQVFLSQMPSANVYTFQEGLLSEEHGSLMSIDRTFDYAWQKEFAGAALMTSSEMLSTEHRFSWTHDVISLSTMVPIEYLGRENFGVNCQFSTFRLQDQVKCPILPAMDLTVGSEILYSISNVGFQTFSSWLNDRSPLYTGFTDVAAFSELHWYFAPNTSATIGVRETYFGFVRQAGFEPRGIVTYNFGDHSNVKLSIGQYLQSPSDFEILHGFLEFLAEPNQTPLMMLMSEHRNSLDLERHNLVALDGTTQIVQNRSVAVNATASLYYKQTQSLIMPARYPSVFTPLDTMSFEPLQDFRGVKLGMGVSSMVDLIPLNVSLTASVFNHHNRIVDDRTALSYYTVGDVPIVAKVLLKYAPPGWSVSLLYQYSTGSPTTDEYYLKASNLLGETVYLPVWQELNSDRLPDYHRLDLTLARNWSGASWKIEAICSVLNLTGSRNVSNYNYSFSDDDESYVRKVPVMNTLPFVPNIELRCEYSF